MKMKTNVQQETTPPISQYEIIVLKYYLIDEMGNEIFKNAQMAS